ncbi:carbohydrate ABC transporter permease [Jiangella muralis]|uniref:carbohydrate ABC transporter permease n=1 Tax=Jiangella muralis TaxID=702383 RepID=UPI00069FFB0F|nr:carbohydrate ABC transporter permease [Jiangella muralis]
MTAAIPTPAFQEELAEVEPATLTGRTRKRLTSRWASLFALVIAVLWTIPTFGLLLTSFRPEKDIRTSGWWTWFSDPQLTLANYDEVLYGGTSLSTYFINSLVITIPSVIIPISIACLASYSFAWMKFPFRDTLFVAVFALQIVPLQVALIPLLRMFVNADLNGTFWPLWISHTIFALPLAIFLLHNFMREVPGELMEAARVDGAGHVTIFLRIMLPLVTPAIAAIAIFQFLWVWNDLLVAITMATGAQDIQPLTARLAELVGSRGSTWHLLSAGAFVSIVVPVIVFLFLQRYFVRGLLAGSVKG